jgi:hypothetical protein
VGTGTPGRAARARRSQGSRCRRARAAARERSRPGALDRAVATRPHPSQGPRLERSRPGSPELAFLPALTDLSAARAPHHPEAADPIGSSPGSLFLFS